MSTWSRGLCFPQPRTRTICDLISSYKFIFFKHLFLTKILAIWLTFEFNLNIIICFRGKMTKFNLECFSIRKLLLKPPRGWPRLSFPVTDSVARKSQPGGGGPRGAGHTAELRPCLFRLLTEPELPVTKVLSTQRFLSVWRMGSAFPPFRFLFCYFEMQILFLLLIFHLLKADLFLQCCLKNIG